MNAIRRWSILGVTILLLGLLPTVGCVGASSAAQKSTSGGSHIVTLSWNASSSQVIGYNVYRGTNSGGPYTMVNPVLEASTNYVDNTVQAGQTYFYVVTSVDSSSQESPYSNQAQAVIP